MTEPTPLWLSLYLPLAIAAVLFALSLVLLGLERWRNR
jgi:hypothetical protein